MRTLRRWMGKPLGSFSAGTVGLWLVFLCLLHRYTIVEVTFGLLGGVWCSFMAWLMQLLLSATKRRNSS